MHISIWDLDYYYTRNKVNCFNPDVMRISSYHKQMGDEINFVTHDYDIYRPYDLYYLVRENSKTPNPPARFFTDKKVRWLGEASLSRINWTLSSIMLSCRPDYLLYPEKKTFFERSEQIQLFDNEGNLLPQTQDSSNVFLRKGNLEVDKHMWDSSKNNIMIALNKLADKKSLSFWEPIPLQILLSDKDITTAFITLPFNNFSVLAFQPIDFDLVPRAVDFLVELRKQHPRSRIIDVVIQFNSDAHWENVEYARQDFERIKTAIIYGRNRGVNLVSMPLEYRLVTPYFLLFEMLSRWTLCHNHLSWLEYLELTYPQCIINNPATWNGAYRDLLRQTCQDKKFLLLKWKEKGYSENLIPWKLLEKEFQFKYKE